MDPRTQLWWSLLCAVAALNLAAWGASALALRRRRLPGPAVQRWQLWLSAGYVAGCAYRSALPVFDVPRLCMVDSWLSSVLVGRTVATIAELCFAAQWAVLLRDAGRQAGDAQARAAGTSIVPLIALAEVCSWTAVLTTANLGHVLEETIWGLVALLVATQLWRLRPVLEPSQRRLVVLLAAAGAAYAAYMFGVDVPMYWHRWLAEQAAGQPYLGLLAGASDAAGRWVVSHRWADWHTEVVWMTLYFSVAVWISIALVHAPPWRLRTARVSAIRQAARRSPLAALPQHRGR